MVPLLTGFCHATLQPSYIARLPTELPGALGIFLGFFLGCFLTLKIRHMYRNVYGAPAEFSLFFAFNDDCRRFAVNCR